LAKILKVSDFTETEIRRILADSAFRIRIGNFAVSISSNIPSLSGHLSCLYGDFELLSDDDFIDFWVGVRTPNLLRSFVRPQVVFSFDGYLPFSPLPIAQAGAMFEWGVNWCIANTAQQYLIVHAAVVEKNGLAVIMPGQPGSGKSTLCAALVCHGWRLLSDELALISVRDRLIYPLSRPISLKNKSIEVIQSHFPAAIMSAKIHDTSKGTIAHMKPPSESVVSRKCPASPARIVFPKYQSDESAETIPVAQGDAFVRMIRNSFNYNVLGVEGFELMANLIEKTESSYFQYHDLHDALEYFDKLVLVDSC
jgi:HprK-related kinase A